MILNVAIVSEEYLFIFQENNQPFNYNPSLLIFERTTFIPIKKFDFVSITTIYRAFFSTNQKYYFFGEDDSILQALAIDSSLNYLSVLKTFESSRVNFKNNFLSVALYKNMFTITESGPMRGTQKSTVSNIIFHKISLDFESESWEALNTVNGTTFATEYSSTNITSGYLFVNSGTVNSAILPLKDTKIGQCLK